jgi:Myb DNA-binding like
MAVTTTTTTTAASYSSPVAGTTYPESSPVRNYAATSSGIPKRGIVARKRKQSAGAVKIRSFRPARISRPTTNSQIGNQQPPPAVGDSSVTHSGTATYSPEKKTAGTSPLNKEHLYTTSVVAPSTPRQRDQEAERLQQLADETEKLQRLLSEDPEEARLKTFCSKFKGPKRPRTTKAKKDKENDSDNTTAAARRSTALPDVNNNTASGRAGPSTLPPRTAAATVTAPEQPMTGTPVVQIINGEIVLQESSLMVPGARRSVQEVEAEFNVVEEDAHMAIVGASYNSFVNRRAPQHWSVDETKRFYDALRQLGTDFCSMEAYFDNRTRKQLKRKYQIESAKNPQLIEMALNPKYHTEIGTSQFFTQCCSKSPAAFVVTDPKSCALLLIFWLSRSLIYFNKSFRLVRV